MTDDIAPRGPGRPRLYPPGTTGADRKALGRRVLKAAGGHAIELELGAAAWRALQKLAPHGERGPYIERLILATYRGASAAATPDSETPQPNDQPERC